MELRALTLEDKPALDALMAEAFELGRRSEPDKAASPPVGYEDTLRLGIFDRGRLVAILAVHPIPMTWGEQDLTLGGVADVACTVNQRGHGHVARLLAESLRRMRETDQFLSGLYPFSHKFYRNHGWEWVGERRRFTVATRGIPSFPDGASVRSYHGAEAFEIVRPVYTAFARRYRGMTTRSNRNPNFWDAALAHNDNRTTYVHVYHDLESDRAQGYLVFRYVGDGKPARIRDFVAATPEAYRGLLSVVHYYGHQVEKATWSGPADDPLPLYVTHDHIETSVSPLFMGRIVDVRKALESLRVPDTVKGRVRLLVGDNQAEWNQQTFDLAIGEGHIAVAGTTREPGVTLDIQALSQAYWGQPGLDRLRMAGRVRVHDEAQYELLKELLPPAICFLSDHF